MPITNLDPYFPTGSVSGGIDTSAVQVLIDASLAGYVQDVTPVTTPVDLAALETAVPAGGQPAGESWAATYGVAPDLQLARVIGGVWVPWDADSTNTTTGIVIDVTPNVVPNDLAALEVSTPAAGQPVDVSWVSRFGPSHSLAQVVNGAWSEISPTGSDLPEYKVADLGGATTPDAVTPGIYQPYHIRAFWYTEAQASRVVYRHDPSYVGYAFNQVVVGTDGKFYRALTAGPTEVPTDAGQTQWSPVDLVPDPIPTDQGKILRVDSAGNYILVTEDPAPSPLWQPSTAYVTGEVVTATDPDDGLLHRYISLSDRTSGATFDLTEEASWQDTGATTVLVGATDVIDGAQGEAPQPVAGDHLDVLTGAATWDYRPRYLGVVNDVAEMLALSDVRLGDEVHVDTAGVKGRGVTYKRIKSTTGSLADYIKTAEVTNPATIDATTDTIDTTAFDISVTA